MRRTASRYIALFEPPILEGGGDERGSQLSSGESMHTLENPDSELSPGLASLANSLSPRIESHPPDGVVLEASARDEIKIVSQLQEMQSRGLDLLIGIASSRVTAILAAKTHPGSNISARNQLQFLSELPIEVLSTLTEEFDEDIQSTLLRWGIHTLGELVKLPEAELVTRLGDPGLRLQKLSRGEDLEPFQLYRPQAEFKKRQPLDWSLDSLEPLSFLMGRMLESLCLDLQQTGLSAETVIVNLLLEGKQELTREIRLAFPMRAPKILLSLLRLDLQSHPPQAPIKEVSLEIRPTRPRSLQYSLLQSSIPNPEKLSRTLARLNVLVGEGRLGSPSLLNTHRPDAFRMVPFQIVEKKKRTRRKRNVRGHQKTKTGNRKTETGNGIRLVLRRMRPPLAIRIRRDQVVGWAGPWRSSGDWWKNRPREGFWERDEWDLQFQDGSICRVFWDHGEKKWFLDGMYD